MNKDEIKLYATNSSCIHNGKPVDVDIVNNIFRAKINESKQGEKMLPTKKTEIQKDLKRLCITVCGLPKVGKSTFASQLGDDILFAATEKGHSFLEVFKVDIESWNDFAMMVSGLEKEKHSFKNVCIDVIDNLIRFADEEICRRNKVEDLSKIPFGSGYTARKRLLLNEIKKIQDLGLGIIFVTHVKDKEVKTETISWTAKATSMPESVEEIILGLCDLILFAYVDKDGKRTVRTNPTKFIICAGDRSNKLPETMPLDAKLLIETLKK